MSPLHAHEPKVRSSVEEHSFSIVASATSPRLRWLADGLSRVLLSHGHTFQETPRPDVRFVVNLIDAASPRPYRRRRQATFVMSVAELPERPENALRAGYPLLVRSLSNLVMMLCETPEGIEAHFVTLEQGHYAVTCRPGHEDEFLEAVYERFHPLASSELVINNVFKRDLEPELWEGDEFTRQIGVAGKRLDAMGLLPAPFPVGEFLSPRELRQVYRLYGIGGLSYGNVSARKDERRFWMSASGVDKGRLEVVGQDILMVSAFDEERPAIVLSVPPEVEPRRVSVDAIEHWMIYREHPEVGAIVHVHAWMDGIQATEMNYPCGTRQIAEAVAELIRQEPEPGRAVIGLRNHGVTITGPSMEEIFERIDGRIIPQVPMS